MAEATADALHQKAHRLAGDFNEALDAQDVVRLGDGFQSGNQTVRVAGRADLDGEAREIVVIMFAETIVMARPAGEIVLGGGGQPEQDFRRNLTLRGLHDANRLRQRRSYVSRDAPQLVVGEKIGLVEDHQIGREKLVLVDLFQRVVVIDRWIVLSLGEHRFRIVGEPAGGDGRGIDHRDHAVDGEAGAHVGPVESLDQRLGQREARGLDNDMVRSASAPGQRFDGRQEVVGNGAAEAAIGEFDDGVFRTIGGTAGLENVTVDADVAELVDDEREAATAGPLDDMADQRRLAGPEKAGDDGDGDLGLGVHRLGSGCGGMRATRPDFRSGGRSRHGTRPSSLAA